MAFHQWKEQGHGVGARHRLEEIELDLSQIVEAVVEDPVLAAEECRLRDVVYGLSSQVILIVGPDPFLLVEKAPVQFEEGSNLLVRADLALAQCFNGALLIDLRILQISHGGEECSPGPRHLGQIGPTRIGGFNAKEMMDQFSKEHFPAEIGRIK